MRNHPFSKRLCDVSYLLRAGHAEAGADRYVGFNDVQRATQQERRELKDVLGVFATRDVHVDGVGQLFESLQIP